MPLIRLKICLHFTKSKLFFSSFSPVFQVEETACCRYQMSFAMCFLETSSVFESHSPCTNHSVYVQILMKVNHSILYFEDFATQLAIIRC